MTTATFALANGQVHFYEQDGKRVQLSQVNNTFRVEFTPAEFPKATQEFLTLPAALRVYQWFTKSMKHGYL